MSLEVVILAAGEGKRMHSGKPKVLHALAGRPMVQHVLECAYSLKPAKIHLVLGHLQEQVIKAMEGFPREIRDTVTTCTQEQQLGTGHAVMQAMPSVSPDSSVLILYGDTPLVQVDDLKALIGALDREGTALSLLCAVCDNPFGYGRIIRDGQGRIVQIVEQKDASEEQRKIREINTGMMCARAGVLNKYLPQLKNANAQNEYYLTDLVGLLVHDGLGVEGISARDFNDTLGVNDKQQLATVERLYQQKQARDLMARGVTLADPARFDLRGTVETGKDVFIDVNVIIQGHVKLGNNVRIGAGCVIIDSEIGDNSEISPYSIVEKSRLKQHNTIGPFARLRPGNVLEDEVHVGNFVEVKNTQMGYGTKSGHLSYLGDSVIGKDVNIGAGTITCNYDGANKFQTIIGDNVFVGSDTQLVAPVEVKQGVTIGAGTTVTRKIKHNENDLIITRAPAKALGNFVRPTKKK